MKTVLITGATSGIGLAVVKGMLSMGWRVLMIGRSETACAKAMAHLKSEYADRVVPFWADLSLESETRRMGQEVKGYLEKYANNKLDVLIANAGSLSPVPVITSEGRSTALAVQCFSPVWLYDELHSSLSAAQGRMIFTGSLVYKLIRKTAFVKWASGKHNGFQDYCRAKLGVMWISLALQCENESIRFYVADPVFVQSDLGSKAAKSWLRLMWRLGSVYGMTPAKASGTFVMLSQADSPLDGMHYADRDLTKASRIASNKKMALDFLEYVRCN